MLAFVEARKTHCNIIPDGEIVEDTILRVEKRFDTELDVML